MGYIDVEIWASKAFYYIGARAQPRDIEKRTRVARPLFPSQRAGSGDETSAPRTETKISSISVYTLQDKVCLVQQEYG